MNIILVLHSSVKNSMLIVLILTLNVVYSIRIGSISKATFIASSNPKIFFNISFQECKCVALTASAVV